MRKALFLVFCFFSSAPFVKAQYWQNVGSGTNWVVLAFTEYQNNLYVGGVFNSAGGLTANYIAQWNGSKWDTVNNQIEVLTAGDGEAIATFTVYDSILYTAGHFDSIGNLQYRSIAEWNGSKWDTLGDGLTGISGSNVTCTIMYNKILYVGGNFSNTIKGETLNGIAKWDGTNWDTLSGNLMGYPWTFAIYNGFLYAGGYFDSARGVTVHSIAKWDGVKWDSLGSGINGPVWSLAVYNGELYAGGEFTKAGGLPVNNIAVWNGSKWDSVGGGINSSGITSLITFKGKLFAGGYFDTAGHQPANDIAEWDGSNWYPIGQGLSGGSFGVRALTIYDSTLYAGGGFTNSGSTTLNNIAMWNGPLGVNEVSEANYGVKIFPNPNNGKFAIEEQRVSNREQEIEIYNMLGQQVYQTHLHNSITQINLQNEPAGVYLYRVISDVGDLVSQGKLIIE